MAIGLKVRTRRSNKLSVKTTTRFPARVVGTDGVSVTNNAGTYTFAIDPEFSSSSAFHLDQTLSGSGSGLYGANTIYVTDADLALTAGPAGDGHANPDGASGTLGGYIASTALEINYTAGGPQATFNRGAAHLNVWVDQPNNPTDGTGGFYQSLFMSATTSTNSNGTLGNPRGFLYNIGAQCIVQAPATNWAYAVGYEQDIAVKAGATVVGKVGFFITQMVDDAVQGSTYDAAIMFGTSYDGITPPPGWKYLLCSSSMGNGGGQHSLAATGTFVAALGGTFANFVDISAATVTTHVFNLSSAQKTLARSDLDAPGLSVANVFTLAGLPAISVLSGAAGSVGEIGIGRTVNEVFIGVAGAGNQFFTGTSAGDAAISATNNLWLGVALGTGGVQYSSTGQSYQGANLFTRAGSPAVIVRSGASGSLADISIGRTADELYVGVVASANQFFTGTAAGESAIQAASNFWLGVAGSSVPLKITATGFASSGTNSFTAGNTFTRAASPAITVRSGASGSLCDITLGRTADEAYLGVAGAADHFITGSVAGDFTVRADTNLILGSGASGGFHVRSGGATRFPQLSTGLLHLDSSGNATSSTVATADIANDAVTYAKMQNISATSRVLARKSASAGDTEECTLSEVLDFVGSAAQGDILYRGAATWTRLGAGTSGDFLKTQGAGANPVWATASGSATAATQAEQETGTSTTVFVTPGRQQYHVSAAKAWVRFNAAATLAASYNVSSVTDSGAGNWAVNFTTNFSSANYAAAAMMGYAASTGLVPSIGAATASACPVFGIKSDGTLGDPTSSDIICVSFFGDQ